MTAIEIEDMYELSPMQRGMLFHTLYAPHSGVYIDQIIYQIDGQLEPTLLYKAWQQVVRRHAPLRTAFLWEELDNPLQVVYRDVSLPWEQHDWRDLSSPTQHDRLEALLAADRQRGFDLIKPPLMHLKLLRLSDERHYLVWCHHHLLLDGWSAAIVLQEVFLIYRSLQTGEAPNLPQRLPFRDYIRWLQKQDPRSVETFWRTYLQGVNAPTPLSIEPPGRDKEASSTPAASKAESFQEARLHGGRPVQLRGFRLSDEQLSTLRIFIRQHQLTLNTVIQGAWALLLSRYSGERDIIFGATVAGRPMQLNGAERMIGLFINTLPVRVQIPSQTTIVPWLKHLQDQQAEAHQYEYSPLVQVQGCSEIPRDQPLFESLLVFENYPLENQQRASHSSRLQVRFVQSLEQTNYPLVLVVTPIEQALHIDLGYETARFSEAVIMQMLKHFSTLLTELTRSPERRLEDISLLNAEEKQQLLTTWNEMGRAASPSTHERKTPELSVVEAFQCRVVQVPDRIALVCDHHHLTYEELEQRSNELARELILLGVRCEIAVGVCLERSLELPVALLSIFKANGVYLPLDPGYPLQRLAQMLAEAQVAVILTRVSHMQLFKDLDVKTLCLETADAVGRDKSGPYRAGTSPSLLTKRSTPLGAVNLAPTTLGLPEMKAPMAGDQAAYIMYTSGSTGRPKGVVVPHQALLNHINAINAAYALSEQDRVLQFASASFDVALEELLPSWVQGASVVMISETPAPSALTHLIHRESLSVINLPSSYWHEWVVDTARRAGTSPTPTTDSIASLRLVIIGSEQASAARLSVWQRLVGERVTLRNAYGLTETTITSLVALPGPVVTQNEKRPLPVGRPLANMQAYVLDERLQPVPVGMPGELYIGGIGLARGYLGNPMLTADRFIPHPFVETGFTTSCKPGARLYRSGDRARYLPSGEFEVLGRSDIQIKIRGLRIEPGEIEAHLLQHPAVREALVLAYEDAPGDRRLAAYVVVQEQEPSLMNRLRHFLQETLPPYMVPTLFIPLEKLPRTATGKIDRRALPTPQQKLMEVGDYIAPRTPVEEIVAGIWSEVLHLERTGRTDHFFKLGGHSLQATQVVARLREIMQIALPVRAVYDAPTVAALAARIEQERQRTHKMAFPPLQTVPRDAPLPLSFAQQRLWFLDQLQPESPFYNIAVAFHARGTLNVCALEASVHELLRRHDILRTTFTMDGEQPVQFIAPILSLPLPIIQLGAERDEPGCSLSEDERRALIARLCNEEARRPFDLRAGPLIRVSILRLSGQEHVLLLTLHHIVADGWSVDIFLQELSVLYRGRVQGQPVTLPPLTIQYADYALWQRSWLQGELLERQLAYWRQQLANAPTLLELPTDRPRPAIQTYNGACHTFLLPLALLQRLQLLSHGEGVTPFMALLAGIQALLFRYTGQTDIIIGTPVGGRIQRETEGLIGLFLNTLVLRTQISDDLTYRGLLERVRAVALEAYMHQDLPFEKLVDEMHIERSLSHTPLFQVLLTLQQATVAPIDLYGLRLESLLATTATAKFDLSFELFETPSGLYGLLTYNTDLFDETTVARMVGHLQTLLEDCVARPDVALIELNLLTHAEQQQLLVEWNTLPPPEQPVAPRFSVGARFIAGVAPTIHERFELQAQQTPDAVALVWEQEQLTYQELNARANQLAHHLRLSGIAPEVRVGIYLERSMELVIAVLGILKAGGAYLPLDLDYPLERLAFMLQDAQVSVLLTQEHLLTSLPVVDLIICLNRDWSTIARQSQQNPTAVTQIQNTAYIIYTSGSTGKPKGVVVSHANVTRLFKTSETIFHFTEHDIWTLFHSTAFDFSVWELWGALLYGGRLVMVPYWVSRSSEAFSELLCQQAVTILNQTPSAFRQLIQFEESQATAQSFSLRLVIFGGEALDFASLRPWFERHGDRSPRLINMYGITETTVHVTYSVISQTDLTARSIIGRPLDDLQVYVLDTRLRPVPIGIPGEMYVGGAGLARGYLNRPELTAERFLPHPFGKLPGSRLYRTGDLARFLPDGSLEYLGRIDQQVKLHGFRIELEEIERTLRQHPAVKDALVSLQGVNGQKNQDQQHLVAYVVTPPQYKVASSSELRTYLQAYLPSYMLPALFLSVEELPRLPNGKIDRKRLPAPDRQQRPELDASFVAPGTEIERLLAKIWAEVLGLERVGIYDRFFELGGDSIQVIQATARARKAHLHLTPRQMFQHQTIAELVTVVQASPAFTSQQDEVTGPVPLTPIQRWFLEQNQPETHYYNQALFLETERLQVSLLEEALNYLLRHHDALRMRFIQNQKGWQQQNASIDEAGTVAFLQVDCSGLPPLAQRRIIAQTSSELQASLHLEKGPLLRAASFDLGSTQRLLLIAHHLIIDGVSWGILLEDLATAYQQLLREEAVHLPPKTSSFQQWAQSLLAYANSPALTQEAADWLSISRTPVTTLPVDQRGSIQEVVTEASTQSVVERLSQEETRTLLQDVPSVYHTQINDVLLAALGETLKEWTDGQAFLVDLEGHGREHILPDIDLSRTIGWFTTIFPVLLNLEGKNTPGEVLVAVKEQLRLVPNRGIGYGLLRYLRPDPAIATQLLALPQAELSFNYLGQIDRVSQESAFFRSASEPIGPNFSLQTHRMYKLDILASISACQLQMAWIYSEQLYGRATIEYLAQRYIKVLRRLIDHCLSPDAGGYTPSDFPAAQLNARALSKVAQLLEEDEEL